MQREHSTVDYAAEWTDIKPNSTKYLHRWQATGPPQATVLIVHGLGEHGGRYHRLATDLSRAGFDVFAFDQQGHGLSPERRGCIESYESLLLDIQDVLRHIYSQGVSSVCLFGHSMGGNLVLNYVLRHSEVLPTATIASSPMLKTVRPPHWLVEFFGRQLLRIHPNYRLHSTVVAERLMSDPDEQAALNDDQLFHSQLSLRLGAALLDSGAWALERASQLEHPVLLTHGTQDYMTCPDASEQFAQLAGAICQLRILPDRLHDPFRDSERDEIIGQFIDFMSRQVVGAQS